MTAEERATMVVQDYHAKRCWGYDPVQHADYERLLADAIRAAEKAAREEEREACALLCEKWGCDGYPECANGKHNVLCHHYIAAAIRARSTAQSKP